MATSRLVLTSCVLALSLVSLAACSSTPTSIESAAPTSTATSSPTASADPVETEPAVPDQAFGGDCGAVLSIDDAGSVLAAPAGLQMTPEALLPFPQSARDIGGLNCGWNAVDESAPAALRLTVLPADAAGEDATTGDNYCDVLPGEGECIVSILERGWWFSGTLLPLPDASTEAINTQIETLTSLLETAAGTAGAADDFAPTPPVTGEWTGDVDCAALAQDVDAASLLGQPTVVLAPDAPAGPIEAPPGYYAAGSAAGFAGCTWVGEPAASGGESPGIFVYYLPGGSWIADEVAALPGAQELSGEGIDRAFLVTDPALSADRAQVLHVFDGVNWIAIAAGGAAVDESYLPFAAALVAERNTP
jgi:hypothetical protein